MKERDALFSSLLSKVQEIMDNEASKDERLRIICRLLKDNVSHYDWVGFYLIDKMGRKELVLGPFEGELTEHVRIPYGEGICGQAAELEKPLVVQDVSKETDYLSCSPKVKSEIVVPIFKDGQIVGELDIDSHKLSSFTDEDQVFLEKICRIISILL